MKNFSSLPKIVFKFLFVLSLFLQSNFLIGQSCDQLEILFTDPVCFHEQSTGVAPTDPEDVCKSASGCLDTPYNYNSSIVGLGFTYLWTATGPGLVTFVPNNASPNVTIIFPQIGIYTLNLKVTDLSGNVFTTCLTVNVTTKPTAAFTFANDNSCAGSTIGFTNGSTYASGGMVYSWNFGDPSSGINNYDNATDPTHIFASSGTYNVCLVTSSFITERVCTVVQGKDICEFITKTCCSDTICHVVTIKPGIMKIDCITTMCANETATYTAVGCPTPLWAPPIGGSIISTSANQITIQWGNGAIQGQLTANCGLGTCDATVQIPIIPAVPIPEGNLSPCLTATESYTLPVLPGTGYKWTLTEFPGGTDVSANIYTYPDNNTAWINWQNITSGIYTPGNTYQLGVTLQNLHNCCGPITNFITIIPKETFKANFDQEVCLGGMASLFTSRPSFPILPMYGSFNWTISPAAGVLPPSGTGITFNPTFSLSGNYIAKVLETSNSYCNSSSPQFVSITVLPATPPAGIINGPTTVCLMDILPYSMATSAPSGYHYNWTITGGSGTFEPGAMPNTTGDGVNIKWASLAGQISVVLVRNSVPLCPSPAVTKNVTLATTGAVSGTASVCVDSNASYTLSGGTVPPGTTVTWSVSPAGIGTIIGGQGGTMVTIKWHGNGMPSPWSATVSANTTCGVATPFNVTIYPKFTFTLSQSSDICQLGGTILNASTVANSPTFLWSPSGSTTNPTSVFTAGSHYLTVTNAGGCTYTEKIEVFDPFAIATSCSIGSCTGAGMQEILSVGVTKPGSGTFKYQWFSGTYPSGVSVQGPITNTSLSNTYTATAAGDYYVEVTYGLCVRRIAYVVKQVCCPDVNTPAITNIVQNTCFKFTFTGTTPNPGGLPVVWSFGDGTIDNTGNLNPSHIYAGPGVYCVKLCVGNEVGCGINCAISSVTVPIKAQFVYQLACNGCPAISNTSINLGPGTVTYDWDFGNGIASIFLGNTSPVPPSYCYSAAGTYNLKLTVNYKNGAFTCSDVFSTPITYIPLAINVVPPIVCTNNLVSFSSLPGSSIITSYTWAFGDGNFAYTSPTSHAYSLASPPNYTATLSVTDILGTVCTTTSSINVLPGFVATLNPGYICPGGTATLSPTIIMAVGIYTYAWEELVGANWVPATGPNTGSTYTTASPGTFHVIITAPNGCPVTTNLVPVINVPKPVAKISVSPTKNLCAAGNVTFNSDNHLTGYTSQWYENNLGNLIGTGQSLNYFVSASENYYLVLTNQYGCQDICQIFIEVNAPPLIPIISPAGLICEGTPTMLSIPPTTNNIMWSTGEITNSITVYAAAEYVVTVTNTLTGCSSTNKKAIFSRPDVDLFPHFCQKVTCDCKVPFGIYAPRPLVGLFAPSPAFTVQWFNSPSNTLITTGITGLGLNYTNLPSGVLTGSYYIVMTNPATGCSNKSEIYSITAPTVAECDQCTCKGSTWGPITLTSVKPPVTTTTILCGEAQTISCSGAYTLNASYNCLPTGCNSNVTFVITGPGGPYTGSLPFTFTPSSGTYTVSLTGYCDGVVCSQNLCEVRFIACPPLEVNLISFIGKKVDKSIELNWKTASETGNNYYDLEKSEDGSKFVKLAKVNSKNANSNEPTDYKFVDEFPFIGVNYYRLKAVDLEGTSSISKVISIDFTEPAFAKVYPNPTKADIVTIEVPLEKPEKIKLEWYDVLGRSVKINNLIGNKGQNKFEINVGNLPVGKYLIKVDLENGNKMNKTLNFEKL